MSVTQREGQYSSGARKLFAFTGIAPLGVFVALHVMTTATAVGGGALFDRTFARGPLTTAVVLGMVVLPLAFHAGYGTFLAVARPRAANLPSWLPGLRRAAALITLAFVVGHVIELPARTWTGSLESASLFDVLSAHLSSTWHGVPFAAIAYLTGLAATLTHFALALWAFFPAMGIILADRTRALAGWAIVGTAVLLFLVGANTIVFFATGSRLLGPSHPAFVPDGPPAAACSPKT